jgi:hypothetical protein
VTRALTVLAVAAGTVAGLWLGAILAVTALTL